jgi:hypothetical protein
MMTVEQVNEKFKDVKVTFDSYYKFTFTFKGQSEDGYTLACLYGGSSDDIYRYDVNTDPVSFGECDQWSHVVVKDKDSNKVFSESFDW